MRITLVLLPLLFFSSFAFAEKKLKIGVSLPLTGEAASYGEDARKALTFALERFGGGNVELIFEDDQCSGKGGLAAATKLTSVDKVRAVLGPICSGSLMTAGPVYQREKIVTIGIATSSVAISTLGTYIFRLSPNDAIAAKILAEHVITKKTPSIAVLTEQTEYCESFRKEFVNRVAEAGVPVEQAEFAPGSTDFRTSLLQLRSKGIEHIFLNTQSEKPLILAVEQIRQAGWQSQIYAAYWPSSASFSEALGSKTNGIEFVDLLPLLEIISATGEPVYREFTNRYGRPRSNPIIPPYAIDAFRIMTSALRSKDPLAYLTTVNFEGITGNISFDANRDLVSAPLAMRAFRGGRLVTLPPADKQPH